MMSPFWNPLKLLSLLTGQILVPIILPLLKRQWSKDIALGVPTWLFMSIALPSVLWS